MKVHIDTRLGNFWTPDIWTFTFEPGRLAAEFLNPKWKRTFDHCTVKHRTFEPQAKKELANTGLLIFGLLNMSLLITGLFNPKLRMNFLPLDIWPPDFWSPDFSTPSKGWTFDHWTFELRTFDHRTFQPQIKDELLTTGHLNSRLLITGLFNPK